MSRAVLWGQDMELVISTGADSLEDALGVFDEGFDVPKEEAAAFARGGGFFDFKLALNLATLPAV